MVYSYILECTNSSDAYTVSLSVNGKGTINLQPGYLKSLCVRVQSMCEMLSGSG